MECVTVLLATYNQEPYLYQAIDSVLTQKYNNIQLIISDDGSEYFLPEDVEKYVRDHNRGNINECIVLKNKKNLGTVKNLNNARNYILGKYVAILSGDDLFYNSEVLDNYVNYFIDNCDAEVIVSQVLHYDEYMENVMFRCLSDEQIKWLKEGNNRRLYGKVCMDCFIPAIGTAYTKAILDKIGPFDETYFLVEDWPYYLKLLRLGACFHYADFISAKHRDGGVSHVKRNRVEERNDKYHQDLIAVIRNEIYPNYKYAEKSLQKEVFNYANDRIVISEFRSHFRKMTIRQKIKWFFENKNLPAIFIRGCIRRVRIKKA